MTLRKRDDDHAHFYQYLEAANAGHDDVGIQDGGIFGKSFLHQTTYVAENVLKNRQEFGDKFFGESSD